MTRKRWIFTTIVLALVAGAVAMYFLSRSSSHSDNDRMTKEELTYAASQPDAANSYEYVFSPEELAQVRPAIKPYNCSYGKELAPQEKYLCGVANMFILNEGNFVPCGYMYDNALLTVANDELAGIRIVKTVGWKPGKCDATSAPVEGAPSSDNPGTSTDDPDVESKTGKGDVPLPPGKLPVPNVDPTK